MNRTDEALSIWNALKPMIDSEIRVLTENCVRRKKMTVTTAYNSGTHTLGVTESGGGEVFLPCVSTLASVPVGTAVWAEWVYGASNMVIVSAGNGI